MAFSGRNQILNQRNTVPRIFAYPATLGCRGAARFAASARGSWANTGAAVAGLTVDIRATEAKKAAGAQRRPLMDRGCFMPRLRALSQELRCQQSCRHSTPKCPLPDTRFTM